MPTPETKNGTISVACVSREYMRNNPQFNIGDNYRLCPMCLNFVSKSISKCPGCRKMKDFLGDLCQTFPTGDK